MRSLVINLDRSPERLAWFLAQAEAKGVAVERLPAVDGRALTAAEQAAVTAPGWGGEPLSAGEIAVFLSHRRAWERLLAGDEDWIAVFEDDAHLGRDAARLLGDSGWIPAGVGIVKLETLLERTEIAAQGQAVPGGRRLHRLLAMHVGAAGYLVSRDAAARLLRATERFGDPIDQVLFNPLSPVFAALRVQQLVPALCIQDDCLAPLRAHAVTHGSTLSEYRSKARLPAGRKARREGLRLLRQARDWTLHMASGGPLRRRRGRIAFD